MPLRGSNYVRLRESSDRHEQARYPADFKGRMACEDKTPTGGLVRRRARFWARREATLDGEAGLCWTADGEVVRLSETLSDELELEDDALEVGELLVQLRKKKGSKLQLMLFKDTGSVYAKVAQIVTRLTFQP